MATSYEFGIMAIIPEANPGEPGLNFTYPVRDSNK